MMKAGVDRPGYNVARRADLTKSIGKSLASPTLDKLLGVAIDLDGLSLVEGIKGVVGIWQGEPDGWKDLQTAFACMSWNVRICIGLFQRGRLKAGWSFSHSNLAARSLAHGIATREDVFADWCGRMLLDNFTTGKGLYDCWSSPFEPFMVHLFARWKGLSTPNSALPCPPLGVYQELLDAWDTEQDYSSAVVKACDYHGEHSVEGQIANAEFVRIPHNVFPGEILAVKRVREDAGLPWPTVDHPLLSTPLALLPPSLPRIQNDLLNNVAGAVRSVLPDVSPPQEEE